MAEPFHLIDSIPNIWIRDWGPVVGTLAVHAFRYDPDYAKGEHSPDRVQHAQQAVADLIGKPSQRVDLVLDGGNLVHNGRVAIVTEKVLRENPDLNHARIAERICALGFQRVLFIPNEPGDIVGHADGMVRFSDPRTLLVNDYAPIPRLNRLGQRLHDILETELPEVTRCAFSYQPSSCSGCDSISSAVGCTINFLRTRQIALLPLWSGARPSNEHNLGCDRDEDSPSGPHGARAPLFSGMLPCDELARYGGVLNCISLTS